MKLNKTQEEWLRRICATPKGSLRLTGKLQMQHRTRMLMSELNLIKWSWVFGEVDSIIYIVLEAGRSELAHLDAIRAGKTERRTPLPTPEEMDGADSQFGLTPF